MELSRSKRKKLILSTRRKINVLTALNTDSKVALCDNIDKVSVSSSQSDHGKEVMSFLQREQHYIESLKQLKTFLIHPLLKENIDSSSEIISLVDEILSTHSRLYEAFISGKSDMASILKELSSSLDTYVSYLMLMSLEMKNFQRLSEACHDIYIDFDILQEPMAHITWYTTLFQNLYCSSPKEMYSNFLNDVQVVSNSIKTSLSLKKSALKILRIQTYLFNRKPKIFSPGRTVLKEGILYKVNSRGSARKERVFFLFNDLFLCCKILSKSSDWRKKDALKFCALFPLNICTVSLVLGSPNGSALFKVKCGSMSYLLVSEIPGEAYSWFLRLQAAIGICKKPNVESRSKLNRQRDMPLKYKQISLPFKKPVQSDIQDVPIDEISNSSQLRCEKSSLRWRIIKFLACSNV